MSVHERYGLSRVINARGTYTPLGVSRSPEAVRRVVAEALADFFVVDELQSAACVAATRVTGAEAGAVTHCVAAAITLSVAAAMAGSDPARIAALPDSNGMPDRVVLPAGHAVDYGHPIVTDVRLAGATPILAGTRDRCSVADLETALAHERTACLLLVSSRLVTGRPVDLREAVAAAHRRGVPAIIDGAAQDMRVADLLATGADIVLVSAHKYMGSPTAGLILGRRELVRSCLAQERGIGRAMKATKEAILGVVAALEARARLDLGAWQAAQRDKVAWFVSQADRIAGIRATAAPDPAGMPFSRVSLAIEPAGARHSAVELAVALRAGTPSIWVMEHAASRGELVLEIVPLEQDELQAIIDRLAKLRPPPVGAT
jgi:L-seryl-tRNA(Ser) seleniumtransferase